MYVKWGAEWCYPTYGTITHVNQSLKILWVNNLISFLQSTTKLSKAVFTQPYCVFRGKGPSRNGLCLSVCACVHLSVRPSVIKNLKCIRIPLTLALSSLCDMWHDMLHVKCDMTCDMKCDMTCDMTWHVLWHDMWNDITCDMTWPVTYDIFRDMWHDMWHYKWQYMWHDMCHDIWNVTWHVI